MTKGQLFCGPGFDFFNEVLKTTHLNYLEIGVFNGISIARLAQANPDKTIYGIDPFIEDGCTTNETRVQENESMPDQIHNTAYNTQGIPNIKLFVQTSKQFAEELTDQQVKDMNVGFVLIDGSHHYLDVINDVHLAMRLIGDKTGAIVFDDSSLPGVVQAHNEFLEQYSGRYSEPMPLGWPREHFAITAHIING